MSHHSTHLLLLSPSPKPSPPIFPNLLSLGLCSFGSAKDKPVRLQFSPRLNAFSRPRTQDHADVLQNGLPIIKWNNDQIVKVDTELEQASDLHHHDQVLISNEIEKRVNSVKSILGRLDDGEISISAYDTAWVALIREEVDGKDINSPQFLSSLQWIAQNQLPDGSWGDSVVFSAHDRMINTLACVIALKKWNLHHDQCQKGMKFLKENIHKLGDENEEHMPIGFEVAFPSILEMARNLNLELPYDSPVLQQIYGMRNLKLERIPREILHQVPTTLLHSLEGMSADSLDWVKLLKLQSQDGSFLFSPSATAFVFSQTRDQKCLSYLHQIVQKFNGGVPNVYPVDMFEHIWIVDRLQRLGISRYFKPEIEECVDYVYRFWDSRGICWARNSEVHDIDDTAMGFRILRLFGRNVSSDVFRQFEKDGEFVCFAGQSTPAMTGMFNLYRASQLLFPHEKILEDAKLASSKFLREKQDTSQLLDKWIITKDLPGEVGYTLEIPWYANLPRVESRFYIEHYGGNGDVWIGKTLYRMNYVNNDTYLELAKLDYNNCQALHQIEWVDIQKWYTECKLRECGLSRRSLLLAYFRAAASMFEPERTKERLAWTKTSALVETIASYFKDNTSSEKRRAFVHQFINSTTATSTTSTGHYMNINGWSSNGKNTDGAAGLVGTLLRTLTRFSLDTLVLNGEDITHDLRNAWEKWLLKWEEDGDKLKEEAELLVQTINLTAGRPISEEMANPRYQRLSHLTNQVCYQLGHFQKNKVQDKWRSKKKTGDGMTTTPEIESNMQELVQLVLEKGTDHDEEDRYSEIKQTFLTVAKTYYYSAFCDPGTVYNHIAQVLFERVY